MHLAENGSIGNSKIEVPYIMLYRISFGGAAVRLLFATVNGAGHEVPMYKPVASYAMLSRFIAGRAL